MTRSISILTYSSLFPNSIQPRHGIFVEERLKHLRRDYPVAAHVVAPVPWFPLRSARFGEYGRFARIPHQELQDGVAVVHPRYPVLPGISWRFSPLPLYLATINLVRRLHAIHHFDLIDAHFFYPDGVAATLIGRALGLPVVITARGNDISLMPRYALPRRLILYAARSCDAMVTVCAALKTSLHELGVDEHKVHVLRNGVDLAKFHPVDGSEVRARMDLQGRRLLLSVGQLIERKGNHLTIEALRELPDAVLALVGDGQEEAALRSLAQRCGVADRVRFVGAVAQTDLCPYYSAADALVLASSREGWANVLLESMACGTPALATRVWGTPEVIREPMAGVLLAARSADAIVRGYHALFAHWIDRTATRRYAESFDWAATSLGQFELFNDVLARRGQRPTALVEA